MTKDGFDRPVSLGDCRPDFPAARPGAQASVASSRMSRRPGLVSSATGELPKHLLFPPPEAWIANLGHAFRQKRGNQLRGLIDVPGSETGRECHQGFKSTEKIWQPPPAPRVPDLCQELRPRKGWPSANKILGPVKADLTTRGWCGAYG